MLEKENPQRLKIHWAFTQANVADTHFGRIDTSLVNYLLKQTEDKLPEAFYLCGPESMIHIATDQLVKKGISKEQIFFELFTANKDTASVETSAEKGILTLTCDEVTHSIELVAGKTLLDIALQAKLDVPYSCQGGVCSSCIARVTDGKASMQSNQILTDEEVKEGLVLSCQAIAQTEQISLDYDDV
jgi:ring-1,2-phenylacetyl-CoA epoxidase subunit PaaE